MRRQGGLDPLPATIGSLEPPWRPRLPRVFCFRAGPPEAEPPPDAWAPHFRAHPGRSGASFRKSPSVDLGNRVGNPGRPAPPPRAAPRRCPMGSRARNFSGRPGKVAGLGPARRQTNAASFCLGTGPKLSPSKLKKITTRLPIMLQHHRLVGGLRGPRARRGAGRGSTRPRSGARLRQGPGGLL